MTKFFLRDSIRKGLAHMEGFVEAVQFLLSAVAVFMVVCNEFVSPAMHLPGLNVGWPDLQVFLRLVTWSVFVGAFVAYGLASGRLLRYARQHLLELIVCATWIPYYDGALLRHMHLGNLLSLEMLTLIGSIAHLIRVARWTIHRFNRHPLIVITASAGVLITSASALLTQVEPSTFANLSDAAWFCVETIFTVGYGDVTPHTPAGRLVATGLIICGVGLAGVFIGIVSKLVQERLLKQQHETTSDDLLGQLAANNRLLEQLVAQQQETNELNRRLLELLKVEKSAGDK